MEVNIPDEVFIQHTNDGTTKDLCFKCAVLEVLKGDLKNEKFKVKLRVS